MLAARLGEFAALTTAVFWTITALVFEFAGKRIGALAVNLLRLNLAFIFLGIYCQLTRGLMLPLDATPAAWFWLTLSGLVGLVLGDQFLLHAFVKIGARVSMLIMSLVPPLTAFFSWLILGETLSWIDLGGMLLTLAGISIVILQRNSVQNHLEFSHPISGILAALGGAVGQSAGLILSKLGMGQYHAFAATQIRVISGIVGFVGLIFMMRAWPQVRTALKDRMALKWVTVGAVFGPFLGIGFSLLAIQHTTAGVAATIMSIVPVFIIPPAVILFHEKITLREIVGALIAVAGVSLLLLI
ncbi:DMT family transporter [candidate division KSB1 bacterium]|nr:DMT family transporter [candidate division KSB1 bacterium]